jgi:hypothetical protein
MRYVTTKDPIGNTLIVKIDNDVPTFIGEGEQDAAYLAWVAEGNTAEEWTGA